MNHLLKYILSNCRYVDDITASIGNDLKCQEVIDYVTKILSKYQLFPKKWYTNGQDFEPISFLGMVYDPKHDMIQAKQLTFSNGKKKRGELQSTQEKLIVVKTSDAYAKEKIEDLLTILPKTLRTMLSITNSFYDLTGFIMPLHNQLRATTIDILIDGRTYDEELDDKTW